MTRYEAPATSDQHMWDLWLSHTYQASIVVADDLGIFTALNQAPATATGLASRLGFDERATSVLVRLLASLGLLVPRDHHYHLTDHARVYLVKSSPFYWGPMMRVGINEWQQSTLTAALKKKDSAHTAGPEGTPLPSGTGRSVDGWAQGDVVSDRAEGIAAAMHAHSLLPAISTARNYDFTGVGRILDVGGGSGCFMIAIAQAHPEIRCTILELPSMCAVAQRYIDEGGVSDRVETRAVDMFRQPWPQGFDAVFFSNIWHDWNIRTCTWLAERTFEILPRGGRILLHEMLVDDAGAGPATPAGFSMLMLLVTQGQQFAFGELKTLLEGVGFTGVETRPTSHYYSITTGCK